MVELIDSHCHLQYDFAPKSTDDLVREAADAQVRQMVVIGTDLENFGSVVQLSERYPGIFHTVGVHPHEARTLTDEDLAAIEQHSKHPKCVGIGELGIDYYYELSEKTAQLDALEKQLNLAARLKKPVVVHSRDGEEDLLHALTQYASQVSAERSPGVIHCFTGTLPFGQKCLDMGFYISFSGILTFKNATQVQEAARAFPLDRILVETDAPYLAPIPLRGKKCEPSMVKYTAMKLAEIKGISFEEVARVTTANTRALFSL